VQVTVIICILILKNPTLNNKVMRKEILLFFYVFLFYSCAGQTETYKDDDGGKTILCYNLNSYNMDDILYKNIFKHVNEKILFLNKVHIDDTLFGKSLPFIINDNVVYFDRIAKLKYEEDTSISLNDSSFKIDERFFIEVFLSDKIILLNSRGNKIREKDSYRIFNPLKPRVIRGLQSVFYINEKELVVCDLLSGKVFWSFKDNNALGNFFQTEEFLFLSTKEKLLKFDIKTGKILFEFSVPYIINDFVFSNEELFFSVKHKGLFALNIKSNKIEWEFRCDEDGVAYIDNDILFFNNGTVYAIDLRKKEIKWATKTIAFNGDLIVKESLAICKNFLMVDGYTGSDEANTTIPLLINKENGKILFADWDEGYQSLKYAPHSDNDLIVAMKDNCWLYLYKIIAD